MSKIDDLSDDEKKSAVLDDKGNVLCPNCKKRLAIITEYGCTRNCNRCGENKKQTYGMAIINEPGGRKCY
jgi:predicted amidophosphoribosyltransferase